ncbi:hypothetical protein HMPREF0731_3381 [Pseudoroseomonas cervicalis ATCC 49957]|uniref:Uncharacterized protein n=1 Tax=Pseudoroseomonas cervicalis ATCC 49957 TaxID=525371 RepID=D5RQL9_9PROT|nr:hypothetical protein HMPREF0731_3381 [Pseudoroseomonas cervicalis ATCC 49957]
MASRLRSEAGRQRKESFWFFFQKEHESWNLRAGEGDLSGPLASPLICD